MSSISLSKPIGRRTPTFLVTILGTISRTTNAQCSINGRKHEIYILSCLLLTMANRTGTMIRVKEPTREALENMKIVPEEPYDKVVQRLLKFFMEHKEVSQ